MLIFTRRVLSLRYLRGDGVDFTRDHAAVSKKAEVVIGAASGTVKFMTVILTEGMRGRGKGMAKPGDTYDAGYEPKNLHKDVPNIEGRIHKWILEVNFQYIKICPSCVFPL